MAECENYPKFEPDIDSDKINKIKNAHECALRCVNRLNTKLKDVNGLSPTDKGKLDKAFMDFFGVGIDGQVKGKPVLPDIRDNFKRIEQTLRDLNSKDLSNFCNASQEDRSDSAAWVRMGASPKEFDPEHPWKTDQNELMIHLRQGFFKIPSKEYLENDYRPETFLYGDEFRARAIIHEASHEGTFKNDKLSSSGEKAIYMTKDGKTGFDEESTDGKRKFIEVETSPEDRLKLNDGYSWIAKRDCPCDEKAAEKTAKWDAQYEEKAKKSK